MFSVNLPHAARSRLAERTRLDRILASWGGLALRGTARSPGPTGERWSGRWRCGLLVFRGDLCVVEVLLSVRLLWATTVSDNVICLALSRLSYLIYAFVHVDILTPGEECECAVSFRPVMSTFSHSRATDTCTLPCSSSVRKKVTQLSNLSHSPSGSETRLFCHSHLAPSGLQLLTCGLVQFHVQSLICRLARASVHLSDRWGRGGAYAAMVPAPVSTAATIRQLTSATLHVPYSNRQLCFTNIQYNLKTSDSSTKK